MQVTINGEAETLEENGISIARLLTMKRVESPEMVSVQLNGRIIDRQQYGKQPVAAGDEVEFLYFMGGGAWR